MNIFTRQSQFSAGYIVYKRNSRLGPRIQKDLQLVYVYQGEAAILVDGEERLISQDQATLLLPNHKESFRFDPRGVTRHGWCTLLQPDLDPATIRALDQLPDVLPFSPLLKMLAKAARPLSNEPEVSVRRLHASLVQSQFWEYLRQAGFQDSPRIPLHPAVIRARAKMEQDYRESLELADIARHAGVTPAHLIRLFRQQLDCTPKQFLRQVRCDVAARLLRETGLTAAEIAFQTGFANPHHFSRVFKRCQGSPPGRHRKQVWGVPG